MRYFILKQSKELNNAVKMSGVSPEELKLKTGIVKKADSGFKVFLNMYDKNVMIVSGELKRILEKNNASVSGTALVITNETAKYSRLYWILDMDKIDNKSSGVKKIKYGVKEYIAVSLKTAEEILRNSIFDIRFEEVEIL